MMTQTAALDPQTSPHTLLQAMLDLILRLKVVYRDEIAAMETRNAPAFLALQPDKELLSREYGIRVREIQARGEKIKDADPALRARLIVEQEDLNALAIKSEDLALRMAEVMRRLHERLIDAARYALKQEKLTYAESGLLSESPTSRPIATAINQAV